VQIGLLLHRNPQTKDLNYPLRDGIHHPWPDGVERRVACYYCSRSRPRKRSDDTCAVEHVDCEQRGDECGIRGPGYPDGHGHEQVYRELERGVCYSHGGGAEMVETSGRCRGILDMSLVQPIV
jgi:hypothetical protein